MEERNRRQRHRKPLIAGFRQLNSADGMSKFEGNDGDFTVLELGNQKPLRIPHFHSAIFKIAANTATRWAAFGQ